MNICYQINSATTSISSHVQEPDLDTCWSMTGKPPRPVFYLHSPLTAITAPLCLLPGCLGCMLLETHVGYQRFSAWVETNMHKVVGSKHSLESLRNTSTNMTNAATLPSPFHTHRQGSTLGILQDYGYICPWRITQWKWLNFIQTQSLNVDYCWYLFDNNT